MMPTVVKEQAPVPPPSYQRAQARLSPALHIDALTLVTTLHLLTLCRLAVLMAHRRCPPPLPAGPGGAPRTYSEESLLLIGLLRTLWRLSYQDMHDWLKNWPALALTPAHHPRPHFARLPCAYFDLPLAISTWAAHGRSAGNASSHSGTILTTGHLETPGRWTLAA